jgi:hypothetical protein
LHIGLFFQPIVTLGANDSCGIEIAPLKTS